jgi:hypothetical protein
MMNAVLDDGKSETEYDSEYDTEQESESHQSNDIMLSKKPLKQ